MDMAAVVNANSDCKRDWLQVRKRIYDMKRSIKTKMGKAKKDASKTGSGKSEHIEYTPSEQRLLSVIKNASLHGVGGHDTSASLVTSKPQSLPHAIPSTSKDPAEGTAEPTEEEIYFEDMLPGTSTQQEEVVYSGSLLANSNASEAEDTNLTQPKEPRGELGGNSFENFIAMESNYEGEAEGEVFLNLEPVACPFQDVQDIPDISQEPLVYLIQSGESHVMRESSIVSCAGINEKGTCVPVRTSFTQPAQSRRERDSTQGAKGGINYRAAAEVAFKEQTQMVDFGRRQCLATESIAQSMKDISSFLCLSHTQLLERVHNIDTKFGLLVEKLSGVPLQDALPAYTTSPEESEAPSSESNR